MKAVKADCEQRLENGLCPFVMPFMASNQAGCSPFYKFKNTFKIQKKNHLFCVIKKCKPL